MRKNVKKKIINIENLIIVETYPSIIKLFMIHVTISTNDKRVQRYKEKKASLVNTTDDGKKKMKK